MMMLLEKKYVQQQHCLNAIFFSLNSLSIVENMNMNHHHWNKKKQQIKH